MSRFFILLFSGVVFTFVLDFLWLGILMSDFYKTQLSVLLRMKDGALAAHIPSVLAIYVLIPLGILWFVLPKVSHEQNFVTPLLWGGLFGLILYGVYEFTNYAILEKWTWSVVIIDTLWGMVICGGVTLGLWCVQKFLLK